MLNIQNMKNNSFKVLEQQPQQMILIPYPVEKFYEIIENIVKKVVNETNTAEKLKSTKTITINETAKRLGKSYNTIAKMLKSGVLQRTKDNKVTEQSVNEYFLNMDNENTD